MNLIIFIIFLVILYLIINSHQDKESNEGFGQIMEDERYRGFKQIIYPNFDNQYNLGTAKLRFEQETY